MTFDVLGQTSVTVYVTYQGTPGTWFDRQYYVHQHLPLVMESWAQYGLQSVSAYFPVMQHAGSIAICECCFADEASMTAAFSSPESPTVMADVGRFTEVKPIRVRAVPLDRGFL